MSNSGTGHNVEDMLSSVRRLVSDELPRMPRADVPKGPAALVLTEQQRIAPPLMGHNSRRKSLEDRIAELEAAVADSAEEYEPDGSEDLEQHRPDRIVFKPSRATTRPPAPPLRLTELSLVMPVSEADRPADEVDVEGIENTPEFKAEAELQADVEVALTEAVTSAIAVMAEEALSGDAAFEAALSDAVGGVSIVPEPRPEADAFDALERDDFEAEPFEAEEPDVEAETVEPDVEVETVEATAIDASEMRPLIAAMIRDELQGDLGERITRNVRKLVRQEIQRALTVREIE